MNIFFPNIFSKMESVDTFTLGLIQTYLKDKILNSEFEMTMMETLFRDCKYDLILFGLENGFVVTPKIQEMILTSGELKLYQFLFERKELQLNSTTINFAILSGKLETVKWCRKNGCPWGSGASIKNAILSNNISIVKWLVKEEATFTFEVYYPAFEIGNIEILNYLNKISPFSQVPNRPYFRRLAVSKGNMVILQWLKSIGDERDECMCEYAAEARNLELLQYFHQSGYTLSGQVYDYAYRNEDLTMLKWCRKNQCPCYINDMDVPVDLNVFRWTVKHRLISLPNPMVNLIQKGKLELLKQYDQVGAFYIFNHAFQCLQAIGNGHVEVLKWLYSKGGTITSDQLNGPQAAISGGHLETVKFLLENGYSMNENMTLCAADKGQTDILKWLIENGCSYNLSNLKRRATNPSTIAYIYTLK